MKHVLIIIFYFFASIIYAQSYELTVNISGINSNKGNIKVAVYQGEENFLKKRLVGQIGTISSNKSQVVFKNLPEGEYAVSIYHDENQNNKLDAGWFGIPKEGYGTSNDAKGFMGPPKYKDAKFKISNNSKINIQLNY